MKLLRWIRNNGNLQLEVLQDGKWINYKQSLFYKKDAKTSSNSGFATAQKYLKKGYKYIKVIEVVDFLEHKEVLELFEEIRFNIVHSIFVELDLEGVDSLLMDKLLKVMDLLKAEITRVNIPLVLQYLSFDRGLELYRQILYSYKKTILEDKK